MQRSDLNIPHPFAHRRPRMLVATVLAGISAATASATIVIDDFETEQTIFLSATGGEPATDSNTRSGPIFGTSASERAVFAAIEAPIDPEHVATGSVAIGRGVLSFGLRSDGDFAPGGAAFMQAAWRYAGGINLTSGGLNRFVVQSTTFGPGLELTLSVIDLLGRDASFAFAPGGTTEIAFGDAGWVTTGGPVNFAAVEVVSLAWTSTGEGTSPDFPVHADLSSFRVIPAPGALGFLALAAFVGIGRRRGSYTNVVEEPRTPHSSR
jgi:hypothetical protein